MTAYVYVSLKKSVLDPQGKTIHGALKKMGYKGLEGVRQGKYFELTLDGLSRDEAQSEFSLVDLLLAPAASRLKFVLPAQGTSFFPFGRYCLTISCHKEPCTPERDWSDASQLSHLAARAYPNKSAEIHHAR